MTRLCSLARRLAPRRGYAPALLTVGLLLLVPRGHGAELTPSELQEAKRLYVAKCAKCHEFYEPSAYSEADWKVWMAKMAKTSKLKPEQTDLLNRYTEKLRAAGKSKPKR